MLLAQTVCLYSISKMSADRELSGRANDFNKQWKVVMGQEKGRHTS